MRVLLVSTYELGHQPLHLASPAAALARSGNEVRCLDLSVDGWDRDLGEWAEAIAFSVPMHTAMRLAVKAATKLKDAKPSLPICFFGLYAAVSTDLTVGRIANRVIAGEYEAALLDWVRELSEGRGGRCEHDEQGAVRVALRREPHHLPDRRLLPPLESYARLSYRGEERLVGYVEASHGCVHRCRHCPVPTVYDGRAPAVDSEAALSDIGQLTELGARHITFGDPDFLNRPWHSLEIVRAMHGRFPDLTFDVTTKVEHILHHSELWEELSASGCLFVVSALESVNDDVLARLDKGHTAKEAALAVELLRHHRIEPRPSFLPFTPWTELDDVTDLLDFVLDHDLVPNVDPVQYTIRLLLPEGSLLLEHQDIAVGPYDAESLSFPWHSADPHVDELQEQLSRLVEESVDLAIPTTFCAVRDAVMAAAGRRTTTSETCRIAELVSAAWSEERPHLTEPWFCCAEPTRAQLVALI